MVLVGFLGLVFGIIISWFAKEELGSIRGALLVLRGAIIVSLFGLVSGFSILGITIGLFLGLVSMTFRSDLIEQSIPIIGFGAFILASSSEVLQVVGSLTFVLFLSHAGLWCGYNCRLMDLKVGHFIRKASHLILGSLSIAILVIVTRGLIA